MDPVEAARRLRDAVEAFHPTAWTYNPLQYAWEVHKEYLTRFGGPKKALLVGMNPGPWGMGQNGVPFGDPEHVGDWLGLRGIPVGQPPETHPKRPVQGWDCTRAEMSGKRLWGLLRQRTPDPQQALQHMLIANHCPLLFYNEAGQNITPDKLKKADREPLMAVCDQGIRDMAKATGAKVLIGVGAYARDRCEVVADGHEVDMIPHPSPASPFANRNKGADWRAAVSEVLDKHGL